MANRTTIRGILPAAMAALLTTAGCDLFAPGPEWQLGVIAAVEVFDEEDFDYMDYCLLDGDEWCMLLAPDTVEAETPFEVRVQTAYLTCPPLDSRVDVTATTVDADLTVWEKRDDTRNCPLTHTADTHFIELVAPSPGEYPIRMHGRIVHGPESGMESLEYSIETTVTVR